MAEQRGLSSTAYGGIKGEDYIPYIPASQAMPEITVASIIMGVLVAVIFGAANTYLGLKVGMTIAAGLPAAIIATGILKGVLRRSSILEANFIQTWASMGESLAGGIIFILPAIILLGNKLTVSTIAIVGILGSLLGILFVVPLRRFLIVEEHGNLLYPEGMAASEVLVSSNAGGHGLKMMMTGLVGGGIFKFLSDGLGFWYYESEWTIKSFQGTVFGVDILASLIGVGYIVGLEIGLYMLAGAVVAWFGLIPLIKFFGSGLATPVFPAAVTIANMSAGDIWSKYIRYIGAGAVATGGFISIIKSAPTIVRSFKSAIAGIGAKGDTKRTDLDLPLTWVIAGAVFVLLIVWFLPMAGARVGFIGSIAVVVFSFFFAVVSARLVGVIGTSNSPVSGMTIASLIIITSILKLTGNIGNTGMVASIIAGGIVCCAIAISGGAAQSLKTTYIIGGTPKKVQIGMIIGASISAIAIGYVVLMLNAAYGIGGKAIAAPQATIMSMIVKGIMSAQLPWTLVFVGVGFGFMCEFLNVPILPVALGLYLPIDLSTGVVVGGIIRVLVEKKFKKDESLLKKQVEKGILISSGLVAGDALVGILVALFAVLKIDINFGAKLIPSIATNPWTAVVFGLILCVWMYRLIVKVEKE